MKTFKRLAYSVRRFLFGRVYADQEQQIQELQRQISELNKRQQGLDEVVLELIDMSGGPGWTSIIQNAILQLDNRIDTLRLVLLKHQENFDLLVADPDEEEGFLVKTKDTLN